MRRASLAVVLAVLVTAVLALAAGCGGKGNSTAGGPSASASSSAGNGPPSTPTAEPTTAPPRTPPTAKSGGEGEGTATEAAAASTLCGYLGRDLPRLRAVGSPVGALAQLAVGLSAWVEKHPNQRPARSSSLDAETERNCPAVRKAVLAVLKGDSFSSVV